MPRITVSRADYTRLVFVAFNTIFCVFGGTVFVITIGAVVGGSDLIKYAAKVSSVVNNYDITNLIKGAVYVLLVVGGAIMVVALVGCGAVVAKKKCHFITYAVIGCVIILAEVAVVVVAYFFTSKVDTNLQSYMLTALQSKYSSSLTLQGNSSFTYSYADDLTLAIDVVQLQFSCCGVINGSDYLNTSAWSKNVTGSPVNLLIPVSCCQMSGSSDFITLIKSATSGNLNITNTSCPFYGYASNVNTGCYSAIKSALKADGYIVLGISAGIIFIQLLLVIFSCCVCKSVDSQSKVTV